jgi:hypothetical protein
MSDSLSKLCEERVAHEFEYRLIYMRPSPYSDERIAVGIVAQIDSRILTRFIAAPNAIQTMVELYGEEGVEQFQFAAGEFRRVLTSRKNLENLTVPTDLLVVGDKSLAATRDHEGLLVEILNGASSLAKFGTRITQPIATVSDGPITKDLFDQVSRLNPLVANAIFNKKLALRSGDLIAMPICGNRIFGAPVSFVEKDLRMRAEAYVAKFRWLRTQVAKEPRLYLLAPSSNVRSDKPAAHIRELAAIAEASDVTLKVSESTEEIATFIVREEAA